MATKKYEIVSPVTLEDGEIVRDGVRGFDPEDEDTLTFVKRGVIRLVPGQEPDEVSASGPAATANAPLDVPTNTSGGGDGPPEGTLDASLVEALGQDTAETLAGGGITTIEQATAATNEELDAIPGVGTKTIEKIRALNQG